MCLIRVSQPLLYRQCPLLNKVILRLSQILAVALGGAIGAVTRWVSSQWLQSLWGRDFPYGTLLVNVLGSFLIGLLYVIIVEKLLLDAQWRAFLMVGILGALTTFSTFSMDTVQMFEHGEPLKALLNVVSNVVCCLVVTWLGLMVGRELFQ